MFFVNRGPPLTCMTSAIVETPSKEKNGEIILQRRETCNSFFLQSSNFEYNRRLKKKKRRKKNETESKKRTVK